jgi:hypothetical protein
MQFNILILDMPRKFELYNGIINKMAKDRAKAIWIAPKIVIL